MITIMELKIKKKEGLNINEEIYYVYRWVRRLNINSQGSEDSIVNSLKKWRKEKRKMDRGNEKLND